MQTSDHALQKILRSRRISHKLSMPKLWSKNNETKIKDITTHLRSGNDVPGEDYGSGHSHIQGAKGGAEKGMSTARVPPYGF